MRPRAIGLRTVTPYSISGNVTSSTYSACPVTLARPSFLRTGGPAAFTIIKALFLMYTHWRLPPKLYDTSMHEQCDVVRRRLSEANRKFNAEYAGDSIERQPVHTVYGGAHLFKAETAAKLGSLAQKHLDTFAPDAASF